MGRIAFFLPSLNFGGIEANTIRLAESLSSDGYQIDLVIGKAGGEYQERISKDINVINLKKKSIVGMLFPLIKYVRKNKPDVIITGGEAANILLATVKLLLPKIKVIISIRTDLTTEYKETKSKKKKIIFPVLSRKLYKKVDAIVTVSKGVADDAANFLGYSRKRFNVIYNPIVNDKTSELINEEIEHKWLHDKGIPVIISVGRLVNQKDIPLLIKAFKIAKEKDNKLKLIIIGDGPEKLRIEKEIHNSNIESDVDMVGFVQNPYPYMKKADVFVLSSKWEGFGNVIVEALSTGVPVVSTDCPSGPSEILYNGKYGSLVEVGNSKQLADALLDAINNDKIGIKKRQMRAQDFSVEKAKKEYLSIIENIVTY